MCVKQAAVLIPALALLALVTACDSFAEYTLINETDEELITWPLLHHCDTLVGHDGDYLDEDVVMPHGRLDYSYISWFPEPECVQVATKDRRVILSEPYEYGGTYTVREPIQPLTTPIPKESDLPRKPFTESFTEAPVAESFLLTIWAGWCVGVAIGTFFGTRFLYRRFQAKPSVIRGVLLVGGALITSAAWVAIVWLSLNAFVIDMPLLS
jgi:hypothetical protein